MSRAMRAKRPFSVWHRRIGRDYTIQSTWTNEASATTQAKALVQGGYFACVTEERIVWESGAPTETTTSDRRAGS